MVRRTLSQMIPKYRNQPLRPVDAEEDFNPTTSVLPSSIELFHFYRQIFAQCAKLSTGVRLLDLSRVFATHLDSYAETVLTAYLTPAEKALSLPTEEVATVLNTADYCNSTTKQLQDRIKAERGFKCHFRPFDERGDNPSEDPHKCIALCF